MAASACWQEVDCSGLNNLLATAAAAAAVLLLHILLA
jgi:hypothetical protein